MSDRRPRIAFGGDRELAARVLRFLIESGCPPEFLLLPEPKVASHDVELTGLFRAAGGEIIFRGREMFNEAALRSLRQSDLDYIFLVHLQWKIPPALLRVPRHGVLNLHPAYLPYNRGWHTPTWAILDGTPFGATLHFMSEEIDQGDVVHQKPLAIKPSDTADSLYRRALDLEFEVFCEAWPALAGHTYTRTPQPCAGGSAHRKRELSGWRRLELDEPTTARQLITRLRGLTTNRMDEACYFEDKGTRYRVQVRIEPGD